MLSMYSGRLYHPTDKNKTVEWRLETRPPAVIFYFMDKGSRVETFHESVPHEVLTFSGDAHIKRIIGSFCENRGYLLQPPEYKVPWKIEQHVGNEFVVRFTINGEELKTKLTIPGADDKITEEMVVVAIENAVRGAARRRRFTGLAGAVDISRKEVEKDGSSAKDSTEGPSGNDSVGDNDGKEYKPDYGLGGLRDQEVPRN